MANNIPQLFRNWWNGYGRATVGSDGSAQLAKRLYDCAVRAAGGEKPNIAAIRKACTEFERDMESLAQPILDADGYYAAMQRDVATAGATVNGAQIELTVKDVELRNAGPDPVKIGTIRAAITESCHLYIKLMPNEALRPHPHCRAIVDGRWQEFCLGANLYMLQQFISLGQLGAAFRWCDRQLRTYDRVGAYFPLESAACPKCGGMCEVNESEPKGRTLRDCACGFHGCTECMPTDDVCPTCHPACDNCGIHSMQHNGACYACDFAYMQQFVARAMALHPDRSGIPALDWAVLDRYPGRLAHRLTYIAALHRDPDALGGRESDNYLFTERSQRTDMAGYYLRVKGAMPDETYATIHRESLQALEGAVR